MSSFGGLSPFIGSFQQFASFRTWFRWSLYLIFSFIFGKGFSLISIQLISIQLNWFKRFNYFSELLEMYRTEALYKGTKPIQFHAARCCGCQSRGNWCKVSLKELFLDLIKFFCHHVDCCQYCYLPGLNPPLPALVSGPFLPLPTQFPPSPPPAWWLLTSTQALWPLAAVAEGMMLFATTIKHAASPELEFQYCSGTYRFHSRPAEKCMEFLYALSSVVTWG